MISGSQNRLNVKLCPWQNPCFIGHLERHLTYILPFHAQKPIFPRRDGAWYGRQQSKNATAPSNGLMYSRSAKHMKTKDAAIRARPSLLLGGGIITPLSICVSPQEHVPSATYRTSCPTMNVDQDGTISEPARRGRSGAASLSSQHCCTTGTTDAPQRSPQRGWQHEDSHVKQCLGR